MIHANGKTQRAGILRLLIDARGEWVPLPQIMEHAAQYNARIHELRHLGFTIENRTEAIDGVRHSWFRLVKSPQPPFLPAPSPTSPEKPAESEYMRRRQQEEAAAAPLFSEVRL